MAHFAIKLQLVLWRNFLIWKRHYLLSIFEILMPLLMLSMLSFVYNASPKFSIVKISEPTYHEARSPGKLKCYVYYTPNYAVVSGFMKNIAELPNQKGFATEVEMEKALQKYFDDNNNDEKLSIPVGVVFEDFPKHGYPHHLQYQIRTDSRIQIESLFEHESRPFQNNSKDNYFEKFIPTQHALDISFIKHIIKEHNDKKENYNKYVYTWEFKLQEMPYPPYTDPGQLAKYIILLPFWAILAFVFMFPSVLKRIIEEQSTGIKEYMKMMGLDAWMLWLGWYIYSMAINIIVITIIALILSVNISVNTRSIFKNIEPSIIWIFLFMYCSASVCFCILISTLFKKPILTMCMGILVWLMTYCFFFYLVMDNDPKLYTFYWYFVMIWPNVCLGYGFKSLIDFEFKDTGLTWSNFMKAPGEFGPHPSMGLACLILLIACIIFLLLSLYIENVFPGGHGIARPWYYLFTKSYWYTRKVGPIDGHLAHFERRNRGGFERASPNTSACIQIRNLSKSFNKKVAVDNLSIDIYDNEITVLLGHNGAGKTITMNIITGMISPNSGTVFVKGFNMRRNINKIRKTMGYCPQHNLQFPDLTVLEHLMFFAMLKDVSKTAAKLESEQFLSRLNMSSKANKMASELSGCMRRKLSLGMALVGHTRILILDEPTSGLDPEARREIWDLLLSMRGERTILITTHYMLEADILGDKIAIMHHGQLICYGASLFLKKHYGTGYTLSLLVTKSWNINTISEAIQNKIASATVRSTSSDFVTFALPTNDTEALSALFSNLEMNKSRLSISSFRVSLTTMEDVFLRVSEITEEIDKLQTDVCTCEPNRVLLTGSSLFCHQFLGLFIKRCQYARHKWISFLLQLLIPLVLISIIMISEHAGEPVDRRNMVLNIYKGSETFYSYVDTTYYYTGEFKHRGTSKNWNYETIVHIQHGKVSEVNFLSDAIVKFGVADITQYHHTLIAAAAINRTLKYTPRDPEDFRPETVMDNNKSGTAMYGDLALHGPPISLNLMTNYYLRDVYYWHERGQISVVNNPWSQFKPKSTIKLNTAVIIMWIFIFPIAFTIVVGFFLHFIHEERRTEVKHLQLMVGVPRVLYWAVIYLFDLLVYVAFCVLVIIVITSHNLKGPFGNGPSLLALSSLMLLYGCAILPLAYIFTYTSTAATSVLFFIWFHVLFGIITTSVVFSLEFLGNIYKEIGEGLTYCFYIFPNFAFSNGTYKTVSHAGEIFVWDNLSKMQKKIYHCLKENSTVPCCKENSTKCEQFYSYYGGNNSLAYNIISLAILVLVYFFILFIFDSGIPRKYYGKLLDMCYDKALKKNVAKEELRIQNQINAATQRRNDVLQVTNLQKYLGNIHAVHSLNFNVKPSECIGLLGSNGAGKTTAFKMLTGEIFPTTGNAILMGDRLHGERSNYLKKIGYCPQVDALNFTLTCREMLQLFAYLRGIPCRLIKVDVNAWMNKFGIKQYENIRCCNLSGGNKRKLSTVIALIGNPPLVMLDVPTSGLDPGARRNLWNILAELRKSGQSIIFTSHSKVECEALCDHFAIMVDGEMKYNGYIQLLKRIYGQGFTVKLKLKPAVALTGDSTNSVNRIETLKRKIESNYCCTLLGEHTGMLLYHVKNRNVTLGGLFLFLEGLRSNVRILEGYMVCDTSLEQEFMSYSRDINDDVERCKGTAR